ncbi:peptidyl-prolyl cis-trans isomerase [Peribacillus alkalitolerans]|uniref:peptidyl-prolyl cis-trans isomerase n=1 Tax=Peribacillus alkalitolerans TaxID=1550385 RepID=UPI0013D6E484|nr:peptidyl-prolyl cis-trans isomerase [Peribacillus alkalitolerans]
MENIIFIKGNVKFPITLDPGVWIFDDRKKDLNEFFKEDSSNLSDDEVYTKAISKHWDREIMEGAVFPPTLKTEKKFEKERLLTGTFAIELLPFLKNSEPSIKAKSLIIETEDTRIPLSMDEAESIILLFSINGKPISEDGPVHLYFKRDNQIDQPIKNIRAFIVE